MSKKKAFFLILFSLELALLIPLGVSQVPKATTTRHIAIDAQRFGYKPSRIKVNKGDTVILQFSTSDVTHGLQLDGYPVELIARKGTTFRKHDWIEDKGHLHTELEPGVFSQVQGATVGKIYFPLHRDLRQFAPLYVR